MLEFRMPLLGADMESGVLVEWLVKPGQQVKRGQIVAVVETQKGAVEVEIWDEGEIEELKIVPGTASANDRGDGLSRTVFALSSGVANSPLRECIHCVSRPIMNSNAGSVAHVAESATVGELA